MTRFTALLMLALFATPAMAQADRTPPSTPTGLSATVISSGQINLAWTASTDNVGVRGYRVYRDDVQIAAMTGTGYADAGLYPGTSYTYAIAAYDAAGNASVKSTAVIATTATDTNPPFRLPSGTTLMTLPPCVAPFVAATLGAYASTPVPPLATFGPVCVYTVP